MVQEQFPTVTIAVQVERFYSCPRSLSKLRATHCAPHMGIGKG
jgi:hypothetical protein